jgi:hypothetical protein
MVRIVGAFLLGLLAITGCTDIGGWDALSVLRDRPVWQYRVPLTIDPQGLGEIITDLPVRVSLDPATLDHDALNARATDLGFYAEPYSEGAQPLSHEIAVLDEQGRSEFWVRLPRLPVDEPVRFWLYFGSDTVEVPERRADVWRQGYVSVLHFEEGTSYFADSSGYGMAASVPAPSDPPQPDDATAPDVVPGLVGRGLRYGGDRDKVVLQPRSAVANMAPVTVSIWIQPYAVGSGTGGRLFSKGDWFVAYNAGQSRVQARFQHGNDGDGNDVFREWVLDTDSTVGGNQPVGLGDWQGFTVSWNGGKSGSDLALYLEDATVGNISTDDAAGAKDDDSANPLGIGNLEVDSGTAAPDAVIDEVRIARADRSRYWIIAEHRSVTNRLVTVGERQALR